MTMNLISKYVFIDTCYFRNKRFNTTIPVLSQFEELCKSGELHYLTTDITEREIDDGIAKFSQKVYTAFKNFKKAMEKFRMEGCALDLVGNQSDGFSLTDMNGQTIRSEILTKVTAFQRACGAQTLDYPPDSIQVVFEKYFNKKKPFGDGKKKSEFPDAFTLHAIRNFATINDTSVYVITSDSDMKEACNECKELIQLDSVKDMLDLYFHKANSLIADSIQVWIKRQESLVEHEITEQFQNMGFRGGPSWLDSLATVLR